MLCKHEVVGSIPSGSTKSGPQGLDDVSSRLKRSYPFRCDLSVSLSAQALGVTKAEWPATRIHVLRRSFRPSISDIVKRKRIRSKAGWGEACSRTVREDPRAERRRVIILSLEQPVVGLEPDRSDPRMRLKQNWSFQARDACCRSIAESIEHTRRALWR